MRHAGVLCCEVRYGTGEASRGAVLAKQGAAVVEQCIVLPGYRHARHSHGKVS